MWQHAIDELWLKPTGPGDWTDVDIFNEYHQACWERRCARQGETLEKIPLEVGDDCQRYNNAGQQQSFNPWQGWIVSNCENFVRRKYDNEGSWDIYNDFNGLEAFPMWDWETLCEAIFGSQWGHEGYQVKIAHDWSATFDYYIGDQVQYEISEVMHYYKCIVDITGNGNDPPNVDTDTWTELTGGDVPQGGFRRCPRKKGSPLDGWPADWEDYDDPAYSYGYARPGDIIGPWLFFDLQKFFDELVWTMSRDVQGIRYADEETGQSEWNSTAEYSVDDEVKYLGYKYVCIETIYENGENDPPPADGRWDTLENEYSVLRCHGETETTWQDAKDSIEAIWPEDQPTGIEGNGSSYCYMEGICEDINFFRTIHAYRQHARIWHRQSADPEIWNGVKKTIDFYGKPDNNFPGAVSGPFDPYGDFSGDEPDPLGTLYKYSMSETRDADSNETDWISSSIRGAFDADPGDFPPNDGNWPAEPSGIGDHTYRGWNNDANAYWLLMKWNIEGGFKSCR